MSENTQNRAVCPKEKDMKRIAKILLVGATAALWVGMLAFLMGMLVRPVEDVSSANVKTDITADFERMLAKKMNDIGKIDSEDVVFVPIEQEDPLSNMDQVYTLSDQDMMAPKPNPACYGTVKTPAEMARVLVRAQKLLHGQETLFTIDTEIMKGSPIHYYLDDTIFAVTWKQAVGNGVYTFSEVKLAHASQFRRFLADGKYGATTEYTTQEMATNVNAVVASSGDYYGYRRVGICVNQGYVYRGEGKQMDTCFVDENGDLLFAKCGQLVDKESAQKFVDENKVRFSLSFGPVMIQNGKYVVPSDYHVGEINEKYSRAALCQMGPLHYVVVTANYEHPYYTVHTMERFTKNLMEMGITKAYALDGGQTAALVMNNKLINCVSYGAQREISDIIYFATAIPEDDWE